MSKRRFLGRFHNDRLKAAGRSDSLTTRKLRCEQLEDRRLLAIVTVNTPDDVVDFNDGRTSLREAIFATNLVPGADEIIFDFGHDGPETITLTEGQLEITDSLTITGAGPSLFTIDASGNDPTPDEHNGDGSRVFRIYGGRGPLIEVSISGLKLTGGDVASAGGAIESLGSLTLSDVEVTDNHANGDGGGLWLYGVATLDNAKVGNNHSNRYGGGIYVQSGTDATIRNSTIIDNWAGISGGGLSSRGLARIASSSTKIYDSNVSSNVAEQAGGGLYLASDNSVVSRTRINGNSAATGGGINSHEGSLVLEDDLILANRAALSGGGLRSNFSTVEVTGTLFMQNETTEEGSHGAGIAHSSGDLTIVDTRFLVNLAHYNPDSSETGASRGGALSISEADVTIHGGLFASNGARSQGGAIWADSATMRVSDAEFQQNRATGDGGAIMARNTYLEIKDSRFLSNSAQNRGGAILVDSSPQTSPLRIHSTEFTNNTAFFAGGAIAAILYENVEIRQSLFRSNRTLSQQGAGGGGAIYALSTSTVAINESVLQGNNTPSFGGALRLNGSTNIKSSLIRDNHAGLSGGGILLTVGSSHEVRIDSTSFVGNRANDSGGAIYASGDNTPITVINSTISQNKAGNSGGGVYFAVNGRSPSSDYHLDHSTIAFNEAGSGAAGGGIFAASRSQVSINHSIIYGNETDVDHQDIAAAGTGSFEVNYALIGGIAPGTPVSANHLLLGVNPLLQPLAPNGTLLVLPNDNGRLLTHALSPKSPAVDAGDPSLTPGAGDTPEFDQRGAPFSRVAAGNVQLPHNSVIDLGAFESQPAGGSLHADFDGDGQVTARDFLIWQRNVGTQGTATLETGDATGNGTVDGNDLAVWVATFGNTVPRTGNPPKRLAAQSATVNDSPALFSVTSLQLGDQPARRVTPSTPSRVSRLESANTHTSVAENQRLNHPQSASYDSVMSNIATTRKAQIDITLENSTADDSDFADLVDHLFAK